MAGSSVSTRTLSLLLLTFFISFQQISAYPLCTDIYEFETDISYLENLSEQCPGISSLVTVTGLTNNQTTPEKTCAFPGRIADGLETLLSKTCLTDEAKHHITNLKNRMYNTHHQSKLVEMYCSDGENSGTIVSLKDLHTKLSKLMEEYMAKNCKVGPPRQI